MMRVPRNVTDARKESRARVNKNCWIVIVDRVDLIIGSDILVRVENAFTNESEGSTWKVMRSDEEDPQCSSRVKCDNLCEETYWSEIACVSWYVMLVDLMATQCIDEGTGPLSSRRNQRKYLETGIVCASQCDSSCVM